MTCECCTGLCICTATDWRLMESGTKVDGDIIVQFPVLNGAAQVMQNSGGTWYPYWYEATGALTYTLEILCEDTWVEIDTWDRNLNLCQGYNERWFEIPFDGSYDLSVLAPDCGGCTDTDGTERDPIIKCILYPGGYTNDKMRGWDAYIFLGTDDDEWTNLNNWLDFRGRTPAHRYPITGQDVFIFGEVLKNSFDDQPAFGQIFVGDPEWVLQGGNPTNPDGKVGIALIGKANFYNESELLETGNCGRVPDAINPYDGGHIVGTCNFYNSSKLSGQVVGTVAMHNSADITAPGEVYGPCFFYNTSTHHGYVEGTSNFYNSSSCIAGKVCGHVTMHDSSIFGVEAGGGAFVACDAELSPAATCAYDLTLLHISKSHGATVCRDLYVTGPSGGSSIEPCAIGCTIQRDLFLAAGFAKNCTVGSDLFMSDGHTEGFMNVAEHVNATGGYFGGTSQIQSAPGGVVLNFPALLSNTIISGASFFADQTTSTIFGDAELQNSQNNGVITGNVSFNLDSTNNTSGLVNGNAVFNASSNNYGTVQGNAEFYEQSENNFGATVQGNAAFYGNSNNGGQVTSSMFFYENSNNDATLTTSPTFAGNSDNSGTITGNPVFNGSATNTATIIGNPTFNGTSTNAGTVTGSPTFNGTSTNAGTVTGSATFNDSSNNNGTVSLAATFNGSSNNNGTAGTVICNTNGTCTNFP